MCRQLRTQAGRRRCLRCCASDADERRRRRLVSGHRHHVVTLPPLPLTLLVAYYAQVHLGADRCPDLLAGCSQVDAREDHQRRRVVDRL